MVQRRTGRSLGLQIQPEFTLQEDVMKRFNRLSQIVLAVVCSALLALGQSAATQDSNNIVPRLVRFSGSLSGTNGKPLSSISGVTFSLYKDSDGGSPLWVETQNVQLDSKGHYSVLLGSTKADGVSSDLFASGEARWLGVQPQGQAEQARVLMVSVPYALKAVDAETLGGMPASAFQLASPQALSRASSAAAGSTPVTGTSKSAQAPCAFTGSGTVNYIAMWQTTCDVVADLKIYQATSGYVGINQTAPSAQLDVIGAINVSPTSAQPNSSGNYEILKGNPVLSIGWPYNFVVPNNGNLYVGTNAGGQGTSNTSDSGLYNTFVGARAGVANQGGNSNSFVGFQAGATNTTGSYNAFLGTGSGKFNTGSKNTFLGYRSGYTNTNGQSNTFVGLESGFANTNGSSNTFVGPESGYTNTNGAEDTFVGLQSGYSNTSGVSNAFLGLQAGFSNTTGNSNTFLGAGACSNITTGNGDICIGYGVTPASGPATSYTILVGSEGVQTAAYVAGIYSETVNISPLPVCISNDGKLGTTNCPAGTGTVTNVGSGLGLTGGPITTTGTLKIDTTVVPLLNTANTFTTNQVVNGRVTATNGGSGYESVLGISSTDVTGCPILGGNNDCAGVVGIETGSTNETVGVLGYTASVVGAGVYGQNQSASSVFSIGSDSVPSAGLWGDSSSQFGVIGTSDNNTAVYGVSQSSFGIPTAYFENDTASDSDIVFETSGWNDPNAGECTIDNEGDLSCDGTLFVTQNISTQSGGTNTDLAGTCTLSGGSCSYPFSLTYSVAPICVATDTTAPNAVQVVVTPSLLTINGTSGDGANYICIGQDLTAPVQRGHGQRKAHRGPAVHARSKEHKQ
jgi:hypothetical protein